MATTRKRRSGSRSSGDTNPEGIELVVRRGARRRFSALKKKTAELPVTVSWDRRKGERRTTSGQVARERRQSDRRQKPPFTWELADFVLVLPRTPSARRTKSKG
jgi:hypothetical protein